jgi:hypothetical protein
VNEERDKVDLSETSIGKESVIRYFRHSTNQLTRMIFHRCTELKKQIDAISDGEFSAAKREVDALRAELGQAPTPTLQQLIEEKSAAYVKNIMQT